MSEKAIAEAMQKNSELKEACETAMTAAMKSQGAAQAAKEGLELAEKSKQTAVFNARLSGVLTVGFLGAQVAWEIRQYQKGKINSSQCYRNVADISASTVASSAIAPRAKLEGSETPYS